MGKINYNEILVNKVDEIKGKPGAEWVDISPCQVTGISDTGKAAFFAGLFGRQAVPVSLIGRDDHFHFFVKAWKYHQLVDKMIEQKQ